ncbi:RNA 2',3'-cyclic phosphodiesterase [Candidatus Bathyarchaeota archaeon]|jgi:RNA 2',3'-cyclic 3'-phosphodiesterase|nr:RNA 2',3'-cyclic phosphodiesterase [Candidatus Bathyarchaeota archaeon]MBT4319027.1 RNA 2',3'-cyclic phosphodiesterase [Candidatus Bathyarchaeota archaeon]MBT4423317.1 RNA 2',3'-cyclic phosphodiesterase [Candidatus Bathyarchaeota archaeon]MBT6604708.1 RNA 2',3'-cyclic phosphodiesterase [Candidatus Bathyarchaeota archaeon]MBT7185836.1 RNA 2',3'-cyclic phosphodiesterase [Candidatus Bathyarchaeota archaeon]
MGTRSFVAVECQGVLHSRFVEAQGVLKATGASIKLVEVENIHITLKFLGDIEDHQVEEVAEVIRNITFEPFEFTVEGVGVFPNLKRPKTIWAGISTGVGEIANIVKEVNSSLAKLDFEKDRRNFHPHLTITRVRGGQNRDRLVDALLGMEEMEFGKVKVDRIYLKKSVLTPNGPIYSTIAESKPSADI